MAVDIKCKGCGCLLVSAETVADNEGKPMIISLLCTTCRNKSQAAHAQLVASGAGGDSHDTL